MHEPEGAQDQTEHGGAQATAPLRHGGVATWLIEEVARLARGEPASWSGLLVTVGDTVVIDGTRTGCRCHFIAHDRNGHPRVNALAKRLAWQVRDYCIPRSEIADAEEHFHATGSTERFSKLDDQARDLFTKLDASGEGGELLLYVLLEHLLGIPQLLCKMPLKTSSEMHYHGADGVHFKLLADGTLALYWGESKLHARVNDAIDQCFASIAPFLADPGGGASERDLVLVQRNLDPGDDELREALARYFELDDPRSAQVEVRAACLIGFDLEDYAETFEAGQKIRAEAAAHIERWRGRIRERVSGLSLESFAIEVFCIPMPSVAGFRDELRRQLRLR